jgi:hypothetical protein
VSRASDPVGLRARRVWRFFVGYDSPEVAALIAELDALRWTGRKGYGARALVGACFVKSLYAIPTWTRTARLIAEHDALQAALGGAPSEWACYRFCRRGRRLDGPQLVRFNGQKASPL